MSNNYITLDIKDSIASLVLDRKNQRNAFDDQMILEISQALTKLELNSEVNILVIKSSSEHFSAGADLNWMKRMIANSMEENKLDALQLANLLEQLANFPKPTIACVSGAAIGGAVGLIAACDLVIAERQAFFQFSEVKLGLIPAIIAPYIINTIGVKAAKRYFLSAESFNAEVAQNLNLVDYLCEAGELNKSLDTLLKELGALSANALLEVKKLFIKQNKENKLDKNHLVEKISSLRVSEDAQKRMHSFLNKPKN